MIINEQVEEQLRVPDMGIKAEISTPQSSADDVRPQAAWREGLWVPVDLTAINTI